MNIETENDLNRANLKVAWALLRGWTPEQLERLAVETVKQWRRDAGIDPLLGTPTGTPAARDAAGIGAEEIGQTAVSAAAGMGG